MGLDVSRGGGFAARAEAGSRVDLVGHLDTEWSGGVSFGLYTICFYV